MKFLLVVACVFVQLVMWRLTYRVCREAEHETTASPMADEFIAGISFFWPALLVALLVLVAFAIPLFLGDRIFESIMGGKRDNADGKHSKGVYR